MGDKLVVLVENITALRVAQDDPGQVDVLELTQAVGKDPYISFRDENLTLEA